MKEKISIHKLLETIWADNGKEDILQFAIWRLVIDLMDEDNQGEKLRNKVLDVCNKELDKWVRIEPSPKGLEE